MYSELVDVLNRYAFLVPALGVVKSENIYSLARLASPAFNAAQSHVELYRD
jgi:hypothetical protein